MTSASIPKIIHYCWFGPDKMNSFHRKCIKSWKRYHPDFEFVKWNESNIDIREHPFLTRAYELKKWAFVADYIRLQKLYEFGGIYLDTDMLLLKPLDDFLSLEAFLGAENSKFISCGIIGSVPKNSFLYDCLEEYDEVAINDLTDFGKITVPQLVTSTFRSTFNFEGDFLDVVKVPGVSVFPPVYFYSFPYLKRHARNKKKYIKANSYAIHLWEESWKDHTEFSYIKKGEYLKGFKEILKKRKEDYSFYYFKKILIALFKSRVDFLSLL